MQRNKSWSVKDVITTVLISTLIITMQFLVNMICQINNFLSMVLSPGLMMLLCGPMYFVMVSRVRKPMVSFTYLSLVGMIYFLMGNWFLLPYFLIVGALCERIMWNREYHENPGKIIASWTIISLLYHGVNLLPIWFFWDTFYRFAMESGMKQEQIDSYIYYYTAPSWLAFILVFTIICGFFGGLIGMQMTRKHFHKAGIL